MPSPPLDCGLRVTQATAWVFSIPTPSLPNPMIEFLLNDVIIGNTVTSGLWVEINNPELHVPDAFDLEIRIVSREIESVQFFVDDVEFILVTG